MSGNNMNKQKRGSLSKWEHEKFRK